MIEEECSVYCDNFHEYISEEKTCNTLDQPILTENSKNWLNHTYPILKRTIVKRKIVDEEDEKDEEFEKLRLQRNQNSFVETGINTE